MAVLKDVEANNASQLLKEIRNKNSIFDNENYLKFVIEAERTIIYYILNVSATNNLDAITMSLNKSMALFSIYEKTVKLTNPDLYERYLEVKKNAEEAELEYNKSVVNDLINAINNGVFSDGTQFSVIEFLKRLPFKNNRKQLYKLKEFLRKYFPLEGFKITNVLSENNLLRNIGPAADEEFILRQILNTKTVIDGVEVSQALNYMILTYMHKEGIPIYSKIFIFVRKQYLKGNISIIESNRDNQFERKRTED